jgi:hypothetical protein
MALVLTRTKVLPKKEYTRRHVMTPTFAPHIAAALR